LQLLEKYTIIISNSGLPSKSQNFWQDCTKDENDWGGIPNLSWALRNLDSLE
jgi:hypothetical protein